MEYPNSIAVVDVFVVHLLSRLVEPYGDLLLFFLVCGPGIEDGLLLEVEVVVLDFKALVDLDVEEGRRVEGDVDVDVLLVVEAGLEVEDAELGGYLQQLEDVLVSLLVLEVGEVLGTVDVLQHEVLVVLDRELALLLHQVVVLAQLELELVDEHLDLLLGNPDPLLPLVTLLQQLLQKLL